MLLFCLNGILNNQTASVIFVSNWLYFFQGLAGIKETTEDTDTVAETASTATVEGAESKEGEKDGVVNTEEKNDENEMMKKKNIHLRMEM